MKFSQELIRKIKETVKLSEILSNSLSLKAVGKGRYKALCPFHSEKTPSFNINDDQGFYHCFGCGVSGDAIAYIQTRENCDFAEAVKLLANHAHITIPKEIILDEKAWRQNRDELNIITKFKDFFIQELRKNSLAISYLSKRNLDSQIIEEFEIGYAPNKETTMNFVRRENLDLANLLELGLFAKGDYGYYPFFTERIIFPIRNHHKEVIAFGGRILGSGEPKYLNSREHKYFKKREILYNFNQAQEAIKKPQGANAKPYANIDWYKQFIVFEGYMDVIAASSFGFKNSVAPLGTSIAKEHLEILWKYTDTPIICFDGDIAGKRAMIRIAHLALSYLLPGKSLNFAILPNNLDPDDLLKTKNGFKEMSSLIRNPLSLSALILKYYLARKSDTPEEKAKVKETLLALAKNIPNELVRQEYLRYFKNAFFQANFQKAKSQTKSYLSHQDQSMNFSEMEMMIFLIENPALLLDEKIDEEFSLCELRDEEMIKIREYLLEQAEKFSLTNFLIWLEEKSKAPVINFVKKRIELKQQISPNLATRDYSLIKKWQHLKKSVFLAHLQEDYRFLISSEDESEQNLAIALKPDIEAASNELSDYET